MRTIAVIGFDGVQLLDVTGPVEALATAGHYDVRIVSVTGADIRTSCGVRLGADCGADELPVRLDTVLVPGKGSWRDAVADQALVNLVGDLAGRSRRTASVCAGAFLLAAAGLLDGRRAATHWQLADDLARHYPAVTVESDPLFVRDGRIITSAGITAGIDLAIALVEEDHGPDLARAVAKFLVMFMARPGGQSQFSARLGLPQSSQPAVRRAMDAVSADPAAPHTLDSLAALAGVSPRHLTRLFRAEIDRTPAQFVAQVRLEAARGLLESGSDSVDLVAEWSGFGSAETMRRTFQSELGVAPSGYRARFRSTAVSPG